MTANKGWKNYGNAERFEWLEEDDAEVQVCLKFVLELLVVSSVIAQILIFVRDEKHGTSTTGGDYEESLLKKSFTIPLSFTNGVTWIWLLCESQEVGV